MSSKSFISSLVLTLLMLTNAAAQGLPPVQESKEEQQKAQQELERKALALLDTTLESAQTLKLVENHALVQTIAADLLWTRDEKRARNLFRDAMMAVAEALNNASAKATRYDASYWMIVQLRQQTLQTIARRDPQFALELLHATRAVSPENAPFNSRGQDQELALEQSIASQVALNDPKRALQMAQESLARGISYALLGILQRLQQKDAEAATRLAVDIIKKLQTENPARNREAGYVGQALLRMVVEPPQGRAVLASSPAQAPEKSKALKLDDQAMHDLADVVVTMALSATAADLGYTMNLQPLFPELEKRVPERMDQLRRKIAEINKAMEPEAKEWMRTERLMRAGTPEEMLEAASTATPETRNGLYTMAAMKFAEAGNHERARQILNDNVSGPERDQLLVQIDRQLMAQAVEQGKVEEAKQLASRMRSKEARATELAYLAMTVFAKGDRKNALQLMSEAQNLVNRQPDNQEQLNALIQITLAYTLIEPPRAFDIIEPVIDQANEMLAAAALLDKFGAGRMPGGPGEGFFKKGEMLMHPGFLSIDQIAAQYGKGLTALARADFDHTKSLADRFQRNEARIMARLLIAQSILSDRPDASDNTNRIFYGRGILLGN
ncbi:MAG TPA: hypothetical protein VGO91_12020 [Pyrinomonadaceae bacterium]|jgi:hypothetical protein|nr:hypothetical protein [Pyrinomonadaceae bacterium]